MSTEEQTTTAASSTDSFVPELPPDFTTSDYLDVYDTLKDALYLEHWTPRHVHYDESAVDQKFKTFESMMQTAIHVKKMLGRLNQANVTGGDGVVMTESDIESFVSALKQQCGEQYNEVLEFITRHTPSQLQSFATQAMKHDTAYQIRANAHIKTQENIDVILAKHTSFRTISWIGRSNIAKMAREQFSVRSQLSNLHEYLARLNADRWSDFLFVFPSVITTPDLLRHFCKHRLPDEMPSEFVIDLIFQSGIRNILREGDDIQDPQLAEFGFCAAYNLFYGGDDQSQYFDVDQEIPKTSRYFIAEDFLHDHPEDIMSEDLSQVVTSWMKDDWAQKNWGITKDADDASFPNLETRYVQTYFHVTMTNLFIDLMRLKSDLNTDISKTLHVFGSGPTLRTSSEERISSPVLKTNMCSILQKSIDIVNTGIERMCSAISSKNAKQKFANISENLQHLNTDMKKLALDWLKTAKHMNDIISDEELQFVQTRLEDYSRDCVKTWSNWLFCLCNVDMASIIGSVHISIQKWVELSIKNRNVRKMKMNGSKLPDNLSQRCCQSWLADMVEFQIKSNWHKLFDTEFAKNMDKVPEESYNECVFSRECEPDELLPLHIANNVITSYDDMPALDMVHFSKLHEGFELHRHITATDYDAVIRKVFNTEGGHIMRVLKTITEYYPNEFVMLLHPLVYNATMLINANKYELLSAKKQAEIHKLECLSTQAIVHLECKRAELLDSRYEDMELHFKLEAISETIQYLNVEKLPLGCVFLPVALKSAYVTQLIRTYAAVIGSELEESKAKNKTRGKVIQFAQHVWLADENQVFHTTKIYARLMQNFLDRIYSTNTEITKELEELRKNLEEEIPFKITETREPESNLVEHEEQEALSLNRKYVISYLSGSYIWRQLFDSGKIDAIMDREPFDTKHQLTKRFQKIAHDLRVTKHKENLATEPEVCTQ